MKISLLVDANKPGGVETHIMNLCEELSTRGHESKIIYLCAYPENILHGLCDKRSLSYVVCRSYRELFKYVYQNKPDILHAHGYKANILGRLIGIITKTPVFTTFHSGEKPIGRLILYNFLDRWTSFLSKNICVNAAIAAHLPSRTKIIPNFVSVPQANRLKTKGPYNIYFIGRFSPEKGPLRFCELSSQSAKNLRWHMVGMGPLLAQCQEVWQKNIHFHGLSDMEAIWPTVDLLCITSTYEGLPLVLLEAMSRGIPVISFDVGSIKEIITDVEYLISCFDLPLMRERISSHFLKSMAERKAMAEKARAKIITNFSKEIVVPKIESYYDEILQ